MIRHRAGYCLLAWILVAGAAYADKGYTIRDLGKFGGTSAGVQVITDRGIMLINVTGRDNVNYQFILDGRRVILLPPGSRGNAGSMSLTQSCSMTQRLPSFAFVVNGGEYFALPPLPNGSGSGAYTINNRGQVGGLASSATGEQHAVVWDPRW